MELMSKDFWKNKKVFIKNWKVLKYFVVIFLYKAQTNKLYTFISYLSSYNMLTTSTSAQVISFPFYFLVKFLKNSFFTFF